MAEGIIAPAGILLLRYFFGNRKKHEENFVGLKTLPIFAQNIRIIMAKRYLDPKADLTFKRVFGEHPDLV